ncbi:putative S-layer protein [Candidatus Pacearchaeota archaeon]|nr:putative S-layer protein [Candidatus Pacearchaeota archaeon]
MKTKIFTLLSLSVLAMVMVMSFGSAEVLSEWSLEDSPSVNVLDSNIVATSLTGGLDLGDLKYYSGGGVYATGWPTESIPGDDAYFEITLTPNTGYDLTISNLNFEEKAADTGPDKYIIKYSIDEFATSMNFGSEQIPSEDFTGNTISESVSVNDGETLYIRFFGYSGSSSFGIRNLNVEGTVTEATAEPVEPNYCISGNIGDWITIKRVKDEKKDNDNEWEWRPLDEIEITVEVENAEYDDKIRGTIEYGLYDEDDGDFIFEEEIDFSIKEDEKEKFTIEFKIDPTDLNEDTEDNDYTFYLKVYDDDDSSEEYQCKQFVQYVEIRREKDEVTLEPDKIEILPKEVGCSSQVELTTTLFNIGTDDQDDVSVRLYNKELGINIMQEVGDIDATDSKEVKFAFTIPADAEEKLYDLEIIIFDEDDYIYEIENHEGDEHDAKFYYSFKVEGNCISEPKVTISADLESEAKAGKELIVKVTITNTGVETSTFDISVGDYAEWASLGSMVPESITLDAGKSEDVLITLNVNSDVSGNQNFEIIVTEGTKVLSKPVAVMIEKSTGLAGITGGLISEGNWPIWTIGAINIILVFIIIIVALKVAKK